MNFKEIILMITLSIISMISTSAGVGGGPTMGVLLCFILNFSISEASTITNFLILISSLTGYYTGYKMKVKNPKMKFVDYNLLLVFCPALLLGTKIGVIFNKILPGLFLNLVLICLLSTTSYKTYNK